MIRLLLTTVVMTLLAGCASTQHPVRPFFAAEQEVETHGRKTWLDRLLETDPGEATFVVAADYQARPPQRIAVLPFVDHGNGDYLVNGIAVVDRSEEERDAWSWTHGNRLRRAVTGALAAREFALVPLPAVDAVLADHGITDAEKLKAVPVEELGRWLHADAVIYGELLDYDAYYALLVAGWRLSARIRIVSTLDGREIFSCTNRRYSMTISPALDPVDIGINAIMNLQMFRDVTLARTEYEVGREIVLRLPTAQRNLAEFRAAAREGERGHGSPADRPSLPLQPVRLDIPPGSAPSSATPSAAP